MELTHHEVVLKGGNSTKRLHPDQYKEMQKKSVASRKRNKRIKARKSNFV